MRKFLSILLLATSLMSCKKEDTSQGTVIFYFISGSGKYEVFIDGQSYGTVTGSVRNPECNRDYPSGIRTIKLATGKKQVRFISSIPGNSPIEREITWQPGCKVHEIGSYD
jgi:hypothetical protein